MAQTPLIPYVLGMNDSQIHSTAIVDISVQIGQNVTVGPYCVIGKGATLHDNVVLKSHVCIEGNVEIGSGTVVYPFVSLGPPQDLKYVGEESKLMIGENCVIREHVTMHTGTASGGMETTVGSNGLFMVGVHIAHDCHIGNNVIMANNATLGGHVNVGNNVLIGGLAAVHQFIRIGDFAVVGGMSGVESDVIPYGRVKGERASLAGLNLVGLEREGFDKEQVREMQKAYKDLFVGNDTFDSRLDSVSKAYAKSDTVQSIVRFSKEKSRFPICQPKSKTA